MSETTLPITAEYCPRFDLTNEDEKIEMLNYLDEKGYAVIASVADETMIEECKDSFWAFWESKLVNLKRNDVSTWDGKNWMGNPGNGIIYNHYKANHCDFLWKIRTLPKVKQGFAAVWGTDDLIVSYDASNAFRPWKINSNWLTNGGWWHVDQNSRKGPERSGKVCVQGLVTLYDVNENTGGLCVLPGSQLHHEEVCARASGAKGKVDFVMLDKDDPLLKTQGGARAVLPCAKAGDLIIWDSRTVHCNSPALNVAEYFANPPVSPCNPSEGELIRLVGYVCMLPYSTADESVLEGRKAGFIHGVGTSHWPTQKIAYGAGSKDPVDLCTVSPEVLNLVGYRESDVDWPLFKGKNNCNMF